MKLEVGMTVYVIPVGVNNIRHIKGVLVNSIEECKVTKVGRKYFYVDNSSDKFNIDNLRHDSECHYDRQAYFDKQEILDMVELSALYQEIQGFFSSYGKPKLTLEQSKRVKDIIMEG